MNVKKLVLCEKHIYVDFILSVIKFVSDLQQIGGYLHMKFVSDLRQVGGFPLVLRFPPPIKLTVTI
jgi:hypothetical protein